MNVSRRHHAEQVRVADEASPAGRDRYRPVAYLMPVQKSVLERSLPRYSHSTKWCVPGVSFSSKPDDVHRLAVRRDRVLAPLAVGAGLDDERRHPHLESVPRLAQVQALGVGGGRESEAGESNDPGGAHQRTPTASRSRGQSILAEPAHVTALLRGGRQRRASGYDRASPRFAPAPTPIADRRITARRVQREPTERDREAERGPRLSQSGMRRISARTSRVRPCVGCGRARGRRPARIAERRSWVRRESTALVPRSV